MRQVDVPVVLLGDAAHLLSPISGSGAGMAMQDALTLGHWLGQTLGPGKGARREWAGLGRAIAASRRAAYQALLSSRAWATEALGVAMPTQAPADGDAPTDEVNP